MSAASLQASLQPVRSSPTLAEGPDGGDARWGREDEAAEGMMGESQEGGGGGGGGGEFMFGLGHKV